MIEPFFIKLDKIKKPFAKKANNVFAWSETDKASSALSATATKSFSEQIFTQESTTRTNFFTELDLILSHSGNSCFRGGNKP